MLDILTSLSPALIAAAATVSAVCITQYKTRKLSFFHAYFGRKVAAYTDLLNGITMCQNSFSEESLTAVKNSINTLCLFAPEIVYAETLIVLHDLREKKSSFEYSDMARLVVLMREDLDNCKSLRF